MSKIQAPCASAAKSSIFGSFFSYKPLRLTSCLIEGLSADGRTFTDLMPGAGSLMPRVLALSPK